MTETPEQFRERSERISHQFYENFEKRGGPLRGRAVDYEKLAVEYSHKGFQTLTYLNGGALVAIPAAMAFFKADVPRIEVMWTAFCFIAGLLAVVLAQSAAFFTIAKRSEANEHYKDEQFNRVAALTYSHTTSQFQQHQVNANTARDVGNHKIGRSNQYRLGGLICFGVSLLAFVAGCGFGAMAVATAKERAVVATPQ